MIESENKENMKLLETWNCSNILYITKSRKIVEKSGYVLIGMLREMGKKYCESNKRNIWIKKEFFKECVKKCTKENIEIIIDYILMSVSNIILISKTYDLEKAFHKLDIALGFGKEVCAVPGDIQKYSSYFANYVIKQGATVICNKYDLNNILIY